MTSVVQQAIATIQRGDYLALVALTVVGYDYILTFSDEINYIWNKPWTCISVLFLLARYFGLCFVVTTFIYGSSFLPGSTIVTSCSTDDLKRNLQNSATFRCDVVIIFNQWALCICNAAVYLMLILRVWALCNRPRFILATLLPLYATVVVVSLLICIMFSTQNNHLGVVGEVLGFSFCALKPVPIALAVAGTTVQLSLSTSMCLFVVIQFIRESLLMYGVTKRLQLSHYMNLLTGQSILYLLIVIILSLIYLLMLFRVPMPVWWIVPGYVPVFTLIPRFTLSLRALYARDVEGRCGTGLDTAFGLTAFIGHDAVESSIAYADGGQDLESEKDEEVAMEERAICGVGSAASSNSVSQPL